MNCTLESAEAKHISDIFALYEQRVQWMDTVGLKQWNVTDYLNAYPKEYYLELQKDHQLYVWKQDHKIIGALALFDTDEYWSICDHSTAFYIHHLVTDPKYHGVGTKMLAQAEKIAAACGKKYLRLDCAVDNTALNQYYEKLGFTYQGKCQDGPYLGNRLEKLLK